MKTIWAIGLFALFVAGGYAEHRHFASTMQTTMGVVDPDKVTLIPAPIPEGWVLEGDPKTMAGEIAHTDDGTTRVFVWQTTAGRFHWFYKSDEVVQILDGEVFIADGARAERRLGPGDVAFFPVGARTTWRVPDHLRKIATLKRPLPGPIASVVRWLRAAKRWVKPEAAFAAD